MSKGSLTLAVLLKYSNDVFVETGTYTGAAVRTALACDFKEIRSVELHKPFYDSCVKSFANEPRVHLYHGDSALKMFDMIRDIDTTITFWLDGHIEVGVPYGKKPIPVLDELDAISRHHIKTHTILVDDRRVMGTNVWFGITEEQVIEGILKVNKNYKISYEDTCNAPNDIIVARLE